MGADIPLCFYENFQSRLFVVSIKRFLCRHGDVYAGMFQKVGSDDLLIGLLDQQDLDIALVCREDAFQSRTDLRFQ